MCLAHQLGVCIDTRTNHGTSKMQFQTKMVDTKIKSINYFHKFGVNPKQRKLFNTEVLVLLLTIYCKAAAQCSRGWAVVHDVRS